MLEKGEGEGEGFAAACFGEGDEVFAGEGEGEGCLLDAGGGGVVEAFAGDLQFFA